MSTRTKQILLTLLSLGSATAITILTKSGWVWAPVALAFVTELRTVLGLSAMPSVSVHEVKARLTGAVPPVGVVLLLAVALGVAGCKTPGTPPTGTPTDAFGHCTDAAVTSASQSILGRVTTALATGDYVGQLEALAVQFGGAEVGCAVDLVIAEFSAKAARSDDTEVQVVLVHARAWRGSNP